MQNKSSQPAGRRKKERNSTCGNTSKVAQFHGKTADLANPMSTSLHHYVCSEGKECGQDAIIMLSSWKAASRNIQVIRFFFVKAEWGAGLLLDNCTFPMACLQTLLTGDVADIGK